MDKDLESRLDLLEKENTQIRRKLDGVIHEARYIVEANKVMKELSEKALKNKKLHKGAAILWFILGVLTLIRFVIDEVIK
jgi:hypothetical protein